MAKETTTAAPPGGISESTNHLVNGHGNLNTLSKGLNHSTPETSYHDISMSKMSLMTNETSHTTIMSTALPKTAIVESRIVQTSEMIKRQLGSYASVVFDSAPTFDEFLDALAAERLHEMPHDGSKWDRVLRWAEGFTGHVHMFSEAVSGFMNNSIGASQLIWGSCLSLLQMGPSEINVLTKAFSVLHRLGLTMYFFLRQQNLLIATSFIRKELAHAFSDLMELTCAINAHYRNKVTGRGHHQASDFDDTFGRLIASFNEHKDSAANAMWNSQIERFDDFGADEVDIVNIRKFLEPQDRVVRKIVSGHQTSGFNRTEFTCEWFSRPLANFARNRSKLLLVTGGPLCGKTVLSGWIVENLQSSLEEYPYDVLSYRTDRNIPSTCSSMSVVKGLLAQALERYVGHNDFVLKVHKAMHSFSKGNHDDTEHMLWGALDTALNSSKTMVVVDGLDQIQIGERDVLQKLSELCAKDRETTVKAIAISRPLPRAAPAHTQHVSIEQEQTCEDIRRCVLSSFSSWKHLDSITDGEKDTIAEKISEKSKGSFLWTNLAITSIQHEQNLNGIKHAVDQLPSFEALVTKNILRVTGQTIESTSILAWILASERPLLLSEVKALLEIDTVECKHVSHYSSIQEEINRACGPLVTIRDGMVFLRHYSIRQLITGGDKSGKFHFNAKEAHHELTLRCLAYVKLRLHSEMEPTFERIKPQVAYDLFDRYELLEYAVRYWTTHFQLSSMFASDDKHKFSALKSCFPSCTALAILEGFCLSGQLNLKKAKTLQLLAYNARRSVLGERSASVLQSLIQLARISRTLKSQETETRKLAFEAWSLSKSIAHVTVTVACAELFIEVSISVKDAERTETVIRMEKVYEFIIERYKHTHGASHEVTIKYTRMLAEFYIQIHEVEKAAVIYCEIYELTVEKYGYFHEETTQMYEHLIKQLRSLSKVEAILKIVRAYHEYVVRTLRITDTRRWKSTIALVKIYEERHEVSIAEEILLRHWRSVTSDTSLEITEISIAETKIEVALAYSKFLCRHERKEESLVILRGVWTEVETRQELYQHESFFKKVEMIASEFRSMKAFSYARSVYSSLWSYCEKNEQHSSTQAVEIATSLAETVTETITSSSTTTTVSKTETTILNVEEERMLREVFQATLKQSTTTVSTIKTCVALATNYRKQQRWSEAVEVYTQTISKVWSSLETSTEVKELTIEYHSEVVEAAMSLASCRFEMLQIEKAEFIYKNIFRSLVSMAKCSHSFFSATFTRIIGFFEKIYKFDKAIELYQESFVYLQAKLGKSHSFTIEILHSYGSLAKRLGKWKQVEQAYYEIFIAYKTEDGCCGKEGLDTAIILCDTYEREERWDSARSTYSIIWQSFVKRGKEYNLTSEFVERIYEKYVHVLERTKSEFSAVRHLAVEYRKTCMSYYGSHSEVTMKATMHLAQICERREEHQEESMSLYEEVLKMTSTKTTSTATSKSVSVTTSTKSVTEIVKKRLATLYSTKTTTVAKAVTLYSEQFESLRIEQGYSSKETLTMMKDLVLCYKKQETKESKTKAIQILKTSMTEIFKSEMHSEKIVESAKMIATTYVECGFKETAISVLHEFRQQIMQQVKTTMKVTVGRNTYAFLAAFAEVVTTTSFSAFMAEIRTEVLFNESYYRAVSSQKEILTIIERGAQLLIFLRESRRTNDIKKLEEEMFEVFTKYISVSHTVTRTIIHKFFHICLDEVMSDYSDSTIIERATDAVRVFISSSHFQEAYDLAILVVRFIHIQGGYRTQRYVVQGFNLSLYMACHRSNRPTDKTLLAKMIELSKIILREALEGSKNLKMSFSEIHISLLNDIIIVLGEQQSFADIEHILFELWASRIVQKTWDSDTVITIGRRLIEARFSRGHRQEAIKLCIDIRYNLKRVWGLLDASTLEFTALLSELYTFTGQFSKALALNEEVLSELAFGNPRSNGLHNRNVVPVEVALNHTELLRHAYHRLGDKDKAKGLVASEDAFEVLKQRYGSDDVWMKRKPQAINHAPSKGEQLGMWNPPENFGFRVDGVKVEKKRQSILRTASSNWSLNGSPGSGNGGSPAGHSPSLAFGGTSFAGLNGVGRKASAELLKTHLHA